MARIDGLPAYGQARDDGAAERLPLRWALPAICGLAVLAWAAVLLPIFLALDH